MRSLFCLSLFFCFLFGLQAQRPKLELDVENPIVQKVLKRVLEEGIPRVTGKNEKIRELSFLSKKRKDETIRLRGRILFQNPKAALGNGDYRFKLRMNSNLLKPKIQMLKLQTFRIWFIRFYKRVI